MTHVRSTRATAQPPLFFARLRYLLASRYGHRVSQERCDDRGELWSLSGFLIALDVLSAREVAIIMLDGSRPDYKLVETSERGMREALEHILTLSAQQAT